jgi:hypothetical protein
VSGLLSAARAQDSRAQAWIHQVFNTHQHSYTKQYLFDAGYRADQVCDYDTALDKLSRFEKAPCRSGLPPQPVDWTDLS